MADESNNNIIVSRIQHRRGLKQDLPQPLRPGEIGLATDSRQVYIGGDPTDPQSAQYNAISYFENTVGARDHTESIAKNQIIAFTVPFVKYIKGEFNGITTEKVWRPDDARSIISANGPCALSSSEYTVFTDISQISDYTLASAANGNVISVNFSNVQSNTLVRIGDVATANAMSANVQSVTGNTITLDGNITADSGNAITFSPATDLYVRNFKSNSAFTENDLTVNKNGIKQFPGTVNDFTADVSSLTGTGSHVITMNSRPGVTDSLSVSYYSNVDVIQAIQGIPVVDGNTTIRYVSTESEIKSFYESESIPEFLEIPVENVRLSETTGLGYIGLQQKHIGRFALGTTSINGTGLTLGEFLTSTSTDSTLAAIAGNTITLRSVVDNVYLPITDDTTTYRYNRVLIDGNVHTVTSATGTTVVVSGAPSTGANITITPILSIDLSGTTRLTDAIAIINKAKVTIPEVSSSPITIFPYIDRQPNLDVNKMYFTQKSAFSSVDVGGIDFELHDDSTGTVSALGLPTGEYTQENSTIRAKLEKWLNGIVNNRDFNLFTNISTYNGLKYHENLVPNFIGNISLTVDETFGEITFCDREEAEHFNYIVNAVYGQSVYDHLQDDQLGTRGLVNLKNNLEIQTRAAATLGQKITTFSSMERAAIDSNEPADTKIFDIDASTYNTFVIEYSMSDVAPDSGVYASYLRTGVINVAAREDFENGNSTVIVRDSFTSDHYVNNGSIPLVVEPKFNATLVDGRVQFTLDDQFISDPANVLNKATHTIGTDISMKYILRRWNSID